jgi:hypothetical protein
MCLKSWGIIREEEKEAKKDASEENSIEIARFNY